MTLQQAIDNIAVYSALHNGVLDDSVKVLDKNVKALEIIKEKKVDINVLFICFKDYDLKEYNFCGERPLTQEEYDLLNEVL